MKKDFLSLLTLIVLSIGCSFVFYQCKKSSTTTTTSTGGGYKSQGANEVWIQSMAFGPSSITVAVNTTVLWTNKDATIHTVTSTTGLFDSGNMGSGATFSHLFNTVGTYSYKCTIHSGMTGTVTVQ